MTLPVHELSIALTDNVLSYPLMQGNVVAQGIRLIPTTIHASEMYWRQLRYGDFDISEMSLSSLFISASHGDKRWVALPVFTMRKFFHTGILVRSDAEIERPADLRGKRVGVPEYQQTAAIWCRGVLEHEFGVRPQDIDWFMERGSDKSHGGATGFKPPVGIRLTQIAPTTNIGEMLLSGELDATLLYLNDANLVDRSRIDISNSGKIRRLFPNPEAEGRRYYTKTGIFPINHTLVIRSSLLEQYPWMALNLYSAFTAARREIERQTQSVLKPLFESGRLDKLLKATLADDVMPYGFKAAEPVLNTIAQYVFEQGLSERLMRPQEIFAPSTHDV